MDYIYYYPQSINHVWLFNVFKPIMALILISWQSRHADTTCMSLKKKAKALYARFLSQNILYKHTICRYLHNSFTSCEFPFHKTNVLLKTEIV